ncbi:hypothetical protein BU25DRAFT_414068 [Macroventuria anomochaeta]|uniref:Uncharacterized protein n=1 Tax=Macroventuria anomochaeta TaxID=301207 RepID=A0ACB6RQ61_9PLEO|nr:uncharacterized protein BU25DRAFT_414068 [Macroventuria anomochaeta]KAF2623914.1 hypothetical protein BU25DRAFT_414068 [Macroventuria anomochaeta]
MSTRRTRRAAAITEVTEEVVTVETRSKRTRAGQRKAAPSRASSSKAQGESTPTKNTSNTRANAQPATRSDAVVSTPAPATNKRRLRSTTTEAASPLRALDEQPAKRQRTTSRKATASTPAPAQTSPVEEEDDEETPIFFTKKFDSFDVDQSEPAKSAFMTGDESAMALLRHVQEASKVPESSTPAPEIEATPAPNSPSPTPSQKPSTPSRNLFSSFTSPFTALKNLFGSSTPAPTSPTPSRQPPADTMTEVLSMPPTPVGERPKRLTKKAKKPNRLIKALLHGVDAQDLNKATAWATQIAADLRNDSTAGEKRKRLETPVLFRDLKHLPSSKPWQSGFSFPEDVLDLEEDDVVPAWAVYTSMTEEEEHETKKTKTAHATSIDDDMPASLNEVFGTSTASTLDFQPRRSIDPSPMFDTPLHHQEGGNVFKELRGHDAAVNDRENLQRELKAGGIQRQDEDETHLSDNSEGPQRAHDPTHGSFSVPDSDSEDEDEIRAQPVWTQAPPPAPTPSHVSLPNTTHHEEVERQRQKLMKHTPHKPSRLQQVSYPSPSLLSDAGDSPFKITQIFGEVPEVEPLVFDDPELDAALAAISTSEGLQAKLLAMNWSMPTTTYDSEEEELSPI